MSLKFLLIVLQWRNHKSQLDMNTSFPGFCFPRYGGMKSTVMGNYCTRRASHSKSDAASGPASKAAVSARLEVTDTAELLSVG